MQCRNRDIDIENKYMDTEGGRREWGDLGDWDYVYTLLEKAMTPHSSTLAWKIPWTEEPGGLQSMGLLGVGHD